MAYIGIDIGTSGVKVVVCNADGAVLGSETSSLTTSNPKTMWAEQNPQDWWDAVLACLDRLTESGLTAGTQSIGLTGQMHGAVLLDSDNKILRPAILWNDGRSAIECEELTNMVANIEGISGNLVMPGFTAPKLLWVAKHEPEIFAKVAKVLLPKDYIRFKLSGDFATDMSDASGTCWLDVGRRQWSDTVLNACDLTVAHMPKLYEGTQITGTIKYQLASRWQIKAVPIAAGAGDNAAGAVGSGVIFDGQTILSLGTSGVLFSATEKFLANPTQALHSFCHALPNKWHVMSVHLSAAACLQWFADVSAQGSVDTLMDELSNTDIQLNHNIFFLPYLSGERTPYNNPSMAGEFIGLTADVSRAQMTFAILEGVAFAFKNGLEVMHAADVFPSEISIIGGGAKSVVWRQLIADVLGVAMIFRDGGDVGPALGAARLAQLSVQPELNIDQICAAPAEQMLHVPCEDHADQHMQRFALFRSYSLQANERRILSEFQSNGDKAQ